MNSSHDVIGRKLKGPKKGISMYLEREKRSDLRKMTTGKTFTVL
jgi:hypothetical protein